MAWLKRKNVMLCQVMDDAALNRIFKDGLGAFVQPKLDGDRGWFDIYHPLGPSIISSHGNVFHGVPHIRFALQWLHRHANRNMALDGEIWARGYSCERINGICSRMRDLDPNYLDMQLHIFDVKSSSWDQTDRVIYLMDLANFWREKAPEEYKEVLQFVPTKHCTTIAQVHEAYNEYVEAGYEGIIVRHPKSPYIDRDPAARPWFILKFKPKKEDIYDLYEFEEAVSEDGTPLGRVGACVCQDAEGNEFRVGPGIGMTHVDLTRMWEQRILYYEQHARVRVQYQNLTSTGGVPRFGKFVELI